MSRSVLIRTTLILLFLVFDLILLVQLLQQSYAASPPVQHTLEKLSFLKETPLSFLLHDLPEHQEMQPSVSLTSDEIFRGFNAERSERKLSLLDADEDLDFIASSLLNALAEQNYDTSLIDSDTLIKEQLAKVDGAEGVLYFDTMIGPRTTDAAFQYWSDAAEHKETISIPELRAVGIATTSATLDGELVGAVVSVFIKPPTMTTVPAVPRVSTPQAPAFPVISNQSVLVALNEYRHAHGIAPLQEHPMLCAYAEKRVQDLITFGGLDGHAGFKKDFADPEHIPDVIKSYPGASIGENLAYQNCINMKTNESFTAPTATALIEWCFDSSTKGHREAQLNPEYHNSCARNKDGYFVILFGE